MAEMVVKLMPVGADEKEAYILYRNGLSAQDCGDYSEALEYYEESLKIEKNSNDRSETLKNMAIIYMSNGEEDRALDTYQKSLDENPKQGKGILANVFIAPVYKSIIAERSALFFHNTPNFSNALVTAFPINISTNF